METPFQNHIDKKYFDFVYEPAEDSYLLIDALELDLEFLKQLNPSTCLEIGSGSGIIITAFGMAFPNCICMATDINQKACMVTQQTACYNKVKVDCINMDLDNAFLDSKFDIIIFNPPYVVTDSSEIGSKDLAASWAGGLKGREVIDRFLPKIPFRLSPKGVFYLLLIEDNIPEEVTDIMSSLDFQSKVLIKRKCKNEKQLVVKFFK